MQQKGIVSIAIVAILIIAGACAIFLMDDNTDSNSPAGDVDAAGKPIEAVEDLDNGIVAIGQDSFRWATYFGLADKCVMIDWNDSYNFLGKSFMYAGRALVDIEGSNTATPADMTYYSHTNCGITDDDYRTILELNPSIVIVPKGFYTDYKNIMNALDNQGINTVAIDYVYTFLEPETFQITAQLENQIDILSKALNQEERGQELKNAFSDCVSDIKVFTDRITVERTAYVGSLAYNGAHGLESSMTYYMPLELAGVNNIVGGTPDWTDSGVRTFSASEIRNNLQEDTILFIDASGYHVNTDNTSKGLLKMFAGHDAYTLAPYIWTGINHDTVFINALQILRFAYGDDVISESEYEAAVKSVYERFYGTSESNRNIDNPNKIQGTLELPSEGTTILEDMNAVYEAVRGVSIGAEVTINSDGTLSMA